MNVGDHEKEIIVEDFPTEIPLTEPAPAPARETERESVPA